MSTGNARIQQRCPVARKLHHLLDVRHSSEQEELMPATSTDTRAAEAATRSFFAAYNAHKVQEMLAACSDDAQLRYVPMGNQGEGKGREGGKTIWSGVIA